VSPIAPHGIYPPRVFDVGNHGGTFRVPIDDGTFIFRGLRQHRIEAPAVNMPALTVGTENEIVFVSDGPSPPRTGAEGR
jgi:hypothetical protein